MPAGPTMQKQGPTASFKRLYLKIRHCIHSSQNGEENQNKDDDRPTYQSSKDGVCYDIMKEEYEEAHPNAGIFLGCPPSSLFPIPRVDGQWFCLVVTTTTCSRCCYGRKKKKNHFRINFTSVPPPKLPNRSISDQSTTTNFIVVIFATILPATKFVIVEFLLLFIV